ncbi:MAG: thioredoxin [Clostridia bacterium]|nr:thioredoxin [Clostridia bacterium]
MSEIVITKDNFEEEVLKSDIPVLIDFWASWCAPCRMLAPVIEELAIELEGAVKVGKVNIDDEQALALDYRVVSIPTVLLFKDGEVVKMSIGYKSKEELKEELGI